MNDHDELDIAKPRPDALCRQLVRRLDPWWGYAFAAALLALGGGIVGVLALITVGPALGIQEKTLAAQISAIVALALGQVLAYVIFTRWRRARTGRKLALLRDGELTTAMVHDRSMVLEKGRTNIDLDFGGGVIVRCAFNVWFGPQAGNKVRVLCLPFTANPHLIAFDGAGRMCSGHITSGWRRR